MEKLVKEIVDKITGKGAEDIPWTIAKELITLILSAVRDGELELPGEVGRYRLLPPGSRTYGEWALDMHIEEGANDFIALRKEEKG